jgi:hypothetical protein
MPAINTQIVSTRLAATTASVSKDMRGMDITASVSKLLLAYVKLWLLGTSCLESFDMDYPQKPKFYIKIHLQTPKDRNFINVHFLLHTPLVITS